MREIINVSNRNSTNKTIRATLTKRQIEVLQLLSLGYTHQEIAETLQLSKRTVDTYVDLMLNKCHCRNACHLIRYGFNNAYLE